MSATLLRRIMGAAPLLVLLAAAGFFAFAVLNGPAKRHSVLIGRAAPALTLSRLPGVDTPLLKAEDLKGRVTVVNFWASWCAPCRVEQPVLLTLSLRKDLTLVGIDYKDDPGEASAYLKHLGNPFSRLGLDGTGRTAIDWGVSGVPETFVVAPDGRILAHHEGPLTEDTIKKLGIAPN